MSLNYNFAFKNSELQRWVPRRDKEHKKTTSSKEKKPTTKKHKAKI